MKRTALLMLVCFLGVHTAYGDGTSATPNCQGTDDTGEVNRVIRLVCDPPSNGGEVIIPVTHPCVVNPVTQTFNLCNNLTIRGMGHKSLLQVKSGSGVYATIFGATVAVSNVVIKDFTVDQNPAGNSFPLSSEVFHVINLTAATGGVTGITVSGMFFDATDAIHTIHLESTGDLRATVTNNYFNFNTTSVITQIRPVVISAKAAS